MVHTPRAIRRAQRVIRREHRQAVPDYRINFDLVSPPDQYRVTFDAPTDANPFRAFSFVRALTITPNGFEEWQAWLDGHTL